MKKVCSLLAVLLTAVAAFGQATKPGAVYGTNTHTNAVPKVCGYANGIPLMCDSGLQDSGTALLYNSDPVWGGVNISNIVYSASANTISASWNTDLLSDSNVICGGKNAVDAFTQKNVTAHTAIVAGLTPNTVYSCTVNSNGVASTAANVTTLPAPATTAISQITVGTWAQLGFNKIGADTFYNTLCSDNNTYITQDDTHGYGNAINSNMAIGELTSENTFAGVNINPLAGYGSWYTSNGTDSAGNSRSNKLSGLDCIAGSMYGLGGRQNNLSSTGYPSSGINGVFDQHYGTILVSDDLGATWSGVSGAKGAAGAVAPNWPLYQYNYFSDPVHFGTPSWVMYGQDDGTLGYSASSCYSADPISVTANCRVDDADAYAYIVSNDGYWNDGSNIYLARVPKAKLHNLNPLDVQYYIGGTSGDGNLDSNWSSSSSGVTSILTSQGQIGEPSMQYIPYLNRYVLLNWAYQNCNNGTSNAGCPTNSTAAGNVLWTFYEAPHPWGPWTSVGTISSYQAATGGVAGTLPTGSGLYNPVLLQRSAIRAGFGQTNLTVLAGGNFQNQPAWYTINYAPLQLNVKSGAAQALDSVCPGTTCPQAGAWSVSRQLVSAYSGNLIEIRRASDNTTTAIGNDGSGNVNSSAISTFCAGTTCGVDLIYDQTNNGNNLVTRSFSVSNECQIYASGAVVTFGANSKVACQMPGQNSQGYFAMTGTTLNSLSAEADVVGAITTSSGSGYQSILAISNPQYTEGTSTQAINMIMQDGTSAAVALFHDSGSPWPTVAITSNTLSWIGSVYNDPGNSNKSQITVGTTASTAQLMPGSTTPLLALQVSLGYQTSGNVPWFGYFTEAYVWNSISGLASTLHTNAKTYYGLAQ